jgi:hypothetical protein
MTVCSSLPWLRYKYHHCSKLTGFYSIWCDHREIIRQRTSCYSGLQVLGSPCPPFININPVCCWYGLAKLKTSFLNILWTKFLMHFMCPELFFPEYRHVFHIWRSHGRCLYVNRVRIFPRIKNYISRMAFYRCRIHFVTTIWMLWYLPYLWSSKRFNV